MGGTADGTKPEEEPPEEDPKEGQPLLAPDALDDNSHEGWIPTTPVDYRRLLYNVFAGVEAGLLNVLEAVTLSALIFSHNIVKTDTAAAVSW